MQLNSLLHLNNIIGECPTWDPRTEVLYWLDIYSKSIHCYEPVSKEHTVQMVDKMPGSLMLKESGGMIIFAEDSLYQLDTIDATPKLIKAFDIHPKLRFNDGKVDATGRIWVGTMDWKLKDFAGTLYSMDESLELIPHVNEVGISNGIGWSLDNKTLFYADSLARTIYSFGCDLESGAISNQQPFFVATEKDGLPDGLTVDSLGNLWCAFWDGSQIKCISPIGTELQSLTLPISRPTSLAFAGPKLSTLYLTSASYEIDLNEEHNAGDLFAFEVRVQGQMPNYFPI